MDDQEILQIPSFKNAPNILPITSAAFSSEQTNKAINLKDRYELLLNKLNDEIQHHVLNKLPDDYSYIENSEENPSQVFSSSSSRNNSNGISSNKKNIQDSNKFLHLEKHSKKKETIDDYIQNLLFELNQWNETWEKCLIMATKVIKYHTVSPQDANQQRAILIDIVQQMCGTIISETKCLEASNSNINYSKYRELAEKRKKDKKRLRKMQKRCENLYMEVQKNREMIEMLSRNKKDQLNQDNFLETLLIKHNKNNNDRKKSEDKILNQNEMQQKNDKRFRKEMKDLHKKRRERNKTNQDHQSNHSSQNSKKSYRSKDHYDYYDTNNSFAYDTNGNNSSYDYNSYNDDYSEPDSMLYSNFDKTNSNSKNLENNETEHETDHSDEIQPSIDAKHDYSQNLKRIIKIVNNLENNCNQIQPSIDDQNNSSSKTKIKKERKTSSSQSLSDHNQPQLNENELSIESLEKKHLSLVEAERSFSTS